MGAPWISNTGNRFMKNDMALHYDRLIDENNDPVNDPPPLKEYMDKWDGQAFLEKLEVNADKTVLEIGVGTGRLAVRVAPFCRAFTGIDLSPKTIIRAKEHLGTIDRVTLICGDFNTYDFSENFDVIYSSLTFMHIEDKQSAVNKVYRLLNPSGRFILSIDKNQEPFIDLGSRRIEIYPDNPEDTESFLKAAGFVITETVETEFACVFVAEKGE